MLRSLVGSEMCIRDSRKNVLPIINSLVKKNLIQLKEEVYEQYKPKLIKYVRLGADYSSEEKLEALLNSLSRAPKQSQVVLRLFAIQAKDKKPIKVSDLEKESGGSKAVIKSLIEKGILDEYNIQTDRIDYDDTGKPTNHISLNESQLEAFKTIKSTFKEKKVSLLHGCLLYTSPSPRDS